MRGLFLFTLIFVLTASLCDVAQAKASRSSSSLKHQKGLASWYGPRHQGKRTASGERFNMNSLTAAHRTLPMGSVVKVKSLTTGRMVTVRINDRGPFAKSRIIDVSKAAAVKLGMMRKGTDRVEITVVSSPRKPASKRLQR